MPTKSGITIVKNHSNELIPTCVTTGWRYSYIFRSVPAGTERKSRTGTQTSTRQPPIPPRVKFRGVSMCFGRFSKFWCVSAGTYISAELLFWVFFFSLLSFFSAPSSSFFFPPSSLSVTFLYFLSFVFLPKRRRKNGFWFKCRAPFSFFLLLVSCFFFFFFLSFFLPALSLSVYLFFTFFFFWFKCRPSRDVIRYLFEIFIPFALWRVMHFFFFFF